MCDFCSCIYYKSYGNRFIGQVISILVSVLAGVIVYGISVIILKIEEVSMIIDLLMKK